MVTTWPFLIFQAWFNGTNYLADANYGQQIWTNWWLMTFNLPLGAYIILFFPVTFGSLWFTFLYHFYNWEDKRMFGWLSEYFTNDLIPYPERNFMQAINEDWAEFVWVWGLESIFGIVNIEEKKFQCPSIWPCVE